MHLEKRPGEVRGYHLQMDNQSILFESLEPTSDKFGKSTVEMSLLVVPLQV